MSLANRTAARDEILGIFKTAWDAAGGGPVHYADVKKDPPAAGTVWARVSVVHASGQQATLANETGSRKFRRTGLFTAQIFTPFGEGLQESDSFANLIEDAFEGKNTVSGIWFRDVTSNEIGQDGEWFQTNVLATFEYDVIK